MSSIQIPQLRNRRSLNYRTIALTLLAVALAVGFVLRLVVIFTDEGIYWPDEIYQSFEPAHRLVFGNGLIPWEFIEGARNWALPGIVSAILWTCKLFGGASPFIYIRVTKIVFALVSLGTGLGVYRLARVYGARELPAAIASSIFTLCALTLYFSHRAMSENAAMLPLVWGFVLVPGNNEKRWRVLLGASFLGLAVMLRIQTGIFCIGMLALLSARRQWKDLRDVFLTLLVWAFIYGAFDAITWHNAPGVKASGWFHSAVVYLRFNLIEGKAAAWGTSAWDYYIQYLFGSMPHIMIVLITGMILAWRRTIGLLAITASFIILHSVIPHKELRFIIPALPFFCAISAVGFSSLPQKLSSLVVSPVVLAVLILSVICFHSLTFGDIGEYLPDRANDSAWDDSGDVNRLMLVASRQIDLCGLFVDRHLAWTGGSTYLHTNAPLFMPGYPSDESLKEGSYYNYAIVGAGSGKQVIARDKGFELVKISGTGCIRYPGYSWRLP